ncbi:MAG: pre-peptidase C-terminal domain-containing protein [Deltaproteobacteria bacterium]|nr:pre-peptidase C-terminal domain-containing protein [Deltaproteobacteria bacterium]
MTLLRSVVVHLGRSGPQHSDAEASSRGSGPLCALVVATCCAVACSPTEVGPPVGGLCSSAQPCAAPSVCADGSCVAPCTEGSCGTGFCDEFSGVCVECREDVDCGAARVCNTFTNLCTAPQAGCTSDDECEDSGRCDTIKGSCVQCIENDDCGFGFACDQLTRTCQEEQGCVTDGDCGGTVCDPTKRTCVECFLAAHCASGECDTVSSTCLAGCDDDDDSEPNDGANAASLASGAEHGGSICPGDVDEFLFTGSGSVDAVLTVEGGRLTIELENEAGTLLTSGSTGLSIDALAQGTYKLVVRGLDAAVEGDYLLALTVTPDVVCEELDAEPNNTGAAALAIPSTGSLRSGSICGADVDFWKFDTAAGDDVTVSVTPGDGAGVVSIDVLTGTTVLDSGAPGTDAVVDNAPAGTLFVRVQSRGGDVGYSLRVTTSAAPPVCVQADAEPNDNNAQARPLPLGATQNGQICAADTDQWKFTANALDDAVVTLTGSNVRARLLTAGGAVIAEGTTSFTAQDVDAGNLFIEIKGSSSSIEASYTVRVALTPEPEPDPCVEGGLEPDSRTDARPLAADGTPASGRICAADSDFFEFTVPAGSARTVGVSTRFTDSAGDLDVRLLDSAGAIITSSAGITDEELIIRSLAAGDYVVEVFGFSGALNTYTVSSTIVTCTEDALEPNDSADKAFPSSARAFTGTRCPQNDDFFGIRLETGDALDATLTGTGLTMQLVSATGSVLQADAADGANRRLQVSSLPAGRYAVRVTGSGLNAINYTLTPTVTPSPARCVDDSAEPNNASGAGFVLDSAALADGSYELSGLTMCDSGLEEDFFAVDVGSNKGVRVFLEHASSSDLDVEVLEQRGTSGLYRSLARAISLTGFLDEVGGQMNTAGRLVVRVAEFGTMPAAGLPYTLGLEVGDPANAACVDDRFDTWTSTDDDAGAVVVRTHTNSGQTDANTTDNIKVAPIDLSPPESLAQLRVCPSDSDFFKVSVAANQKLNVDVAYVHSAGDIDLRVFEQGVATALACPSLQCDGVDGSEHFDVTPTVAKTYFIEVFGFQGANNRYDLSVAN